jgi:hypothetical protein
LNWAAKLVRIGLANPKTNEHMKNKKLFYILLTATALIIIAGIFSAYWFAQKEIITEGKWEVYTDEQNSYSIQYPSGMVVMLPEEGGRCYGLPLPSNLLFILGSSKDAGGGLETVESREVFGTIVFKKERLNIGYCSDAYHIGEEVVGGMINSLEDYRLFLIEPELYTFTSTMIGGSNAIRANTSYPSLRSQFVFIQKPDGNMGAIEYVYGSERYNDIAEKMLSTFKFLK